MALGSVLLGCQQDQTGLAQKLSDMDQNLSARLDRIERQLGSPAAPSAGAARMPTPAQPTAQRPQGPDPAKVYAVPIAGAPFKGAKDAKVTVVVAFEFACPYCEKVRPTLDQLLADYAGDLKIVSKHYVVHPQTATIPAQAACAAHQQGKFAAMEDAIWEKAFKAGRNLGREHIVSLAAELGLDMTRFQADMDGACVEIVKRDQAELTRVGARGTPGFFINGRFLSGARPIDQFKVLIDEELALAKERISKGTPVAAYYDTWVRERGLAQLEK